MRSLIIGGCLILLLSLWPHSVTHGLSLKHLKAVEHASVQNKNRSKRRKRTKAQAQPQRREVQAVPGAGAVGSGFYPNPLLLVVTVTESREVRLNREDEGLLSDLSKLRARLESIFEQRAQTGAFRRGSAELEKTVIIKAEPYLKQEELDQLAAEVRAAGADPVKVLTEAEFNAQFEDSEIPPPPRTLSAEEKERIRQMGPISGGVLNGKAISLPEPAYPAVAKAARASGKVTVAIVIDEEGNVISAEAVAGHPLLRASAVTAAREARFSRTLLSGVPVKVKGVLVYDFIL